MSPRLCFFGTDPDSGNRGVVALMQAGVAAIARRFPEAEMTVFDYGLGVRRDALQVDGRPFSYTRIGSRLTKRYYRPESLHHMRAALLLGGVSNPGARAIRSADAVLDVSGGDSFSDIYGARRFRAVSAPKQMALRAGVPLILLPQTYGPYRSNQARAQARKIVGSATMAWARDDVSYEALAELLGARLDVRRHRRGVDIAFGLEPVPVDLPGPLRTWLHAGHTDVIGLNVSGLLYHDPELSRRFGVAFQYRDFCRNLLRTFLEKTDARILLVSHVAGRSFLESDAAACRDLLEHVATARPERVALVPHTYGAGEIKWVISRLDWFCGTRMHSTIAALSSGVPTAGIAYSMKTKGVFATCGQADHVAEAHLGWSESTVIEHLIRSWDRREDARAELATRMPAVRAQLDEQWDVIAEACARPSALVGES